MPGEEIAGKVLATGRTSEIVALGRDRVLKVFGAEERDDLIVREIRNSEEAYAIGATQIACYGEECWQGRRGIIFDALTGESLTRMAERNLLNLRESGRILARCHAELHTKESALFPEVRGEVEDLMERHAMGFLTPVQKARALEQLRALPGGKTVLHMDFHTNNVFRHRDGFATIDWQTTLRGAPQADVAMTLFLLADAELWPGISLAQKLLYNTVRRVLRRVYLQEYRKLTGMDQAVIAQWRLPVLITRLAEWDIASERTALQREILELLGERG